MSTTDEDRGSAPQCASCGEQLAPGQEWCLSCGNAAPGRLGRHAGARAALTAVGITLALTGGAVAASYAALSKDPVKKGDIAFPYEVVAQPAAPAPEPARTAAKKPAKAARKKPKEDVAKAPAKRAAAGGGSQSSSQTEENKAEQPPDPELIKIPEGAGSLYDPFTRALFSEEDPYDPAAVYDDNRESSWAVTSNGNGDLAIGYVVDLKRERPLQYLTLLTDTPGFRAEIFGAAADEVPPLISDSRWAHLKDRDDVDGTSKEKGEPGDGKEKITFSDGSQKYRFLLIWATTPAVNTPPDPPSRTLRLFDLKLYG